MSDTDIAEGEETRATPPHPPGERRHPSPREYVRIAMILGAITAAEVSVYYMGSVRSILIPLLFLFGIVKFSLVVLWFMHLKFDSRTYARFFVAGIAFAVTLYLVVLISFRTFAT